MPLNRAKTASRPDPCLSNPVAEDQPLHVALFVHRYPPAVGGAEAYAARLNDYLSRRGDHVTVWTTTAVALEDLWQGTGRACDPVPPDAPVRRYPTCWFPLRRYVLKALSLVPVRPWQCLTVPCNPLCPGMWRDVGRFAGPVDVVHAIAFPYAFPLLCGLRLAQRRGVPFVLTPFLHLGDPTDARDRTRRQYTRPHLRWLLRQADAVLVQTRAEREGVVALGVPACRVHLLGLGVDAAACTGGDRVAARAAWDVKPDEVVIGHLANLSEEKGTCDLLRAMVAAGPAGHRWRIVLAGPDMPNFRRFWDRFGHPPAVTRLGVLSEHQKRDFYAGIDVFALPSRTDSFGLVVLEAWANGKPVVVYRAGGPAEVVRDGVDGVQVPCGDVTALAGQLVRLARDPELRRRLGDAGRSRVCREFDWEVKLAGVRRVLAETRVTACPAV